MERFFIEENEVNAAFFARVIDPSCLRQLFDFMPGVFFCIRDRNHRIIACNRNTAERLCGGTEQDLVGKTLHEILPDDAREKVIESDSRVYETGEPVVREIQFVFTPRNPPKWYVTTKLPIFDRNDEVIGLAAVSWGYGGEGEQSLPVECDRIAPAIRLVRQKTHRRVSVDEMAKACGISEALLRREFRSILEMSPHEFEKASRLRSACDALLENRHTAGEIAVKFGFRDQSAFAVQFRNFFGSPPREFRDFHGANQSSGDSAGRRSGGG